MSLSETEVENRLAALKRQREAIDREIADLLLYLDLGRRLAPAAASPAEGPGIRETDTRVPVQASKPTDAPSVVAAAPVTPHVGVRPHRHGVPQPVAFTDDPTGARQYGRVLIEAACEAIARAGRPLHAREIHEALAARGLTVPGRDPVASLNTRLWKRAGEGGPLRRQGEAVYGLAAQEEGPQGSAPHPQKGSPF